jgi:hypothetical protein
MRLVIAPALCAALAVSACATSYAVKPVAGDSQSIRYVQGQATTFAEGRNGSVQVTPLGVNEKGRLVFGVAAFNNAKEPTNFGVENMIAAAGGEPLRIFTHAELERMAKNDATIALVAAALAGAATAYAASQGPTYTSTYSTPRGVYRYQATDHVAQAALAGAAVAGTALTMKEINDNLDGTLMALQGQVLQTTTIDPESSFGGQVITDRVAIPSEGSLDALLTVTWNEDVYQFRWDVSKVQ